MAEHRITISMDFVGSGETEAEAQQAAGAQYAETVTALCTAYGYPDEVVSPPSAEMVTFARQRIAAYLSDVVRGERRKAAEAAALAALDASGVVME